MYVLLGKCRWTVLTSKQVRLWDPKAGKPIGDALKGHTKWITSLSWEPIHLYVLLLSNASIRPADTL